MVSGINNSFLIYLKHPYLWYKRNKYLKKYKDKNISLDLKVSINNTEFGNYVSLGSNVIIDNSFLGNHTYVNSGTSIYRTKTGKFCSIGPNVIIGLGIHPTHLISTHPAFYSNNKTFKTFADKTYFKEYGRIILGNDVWIGSNVIILDNIKIGDGALVAAGAVVTKDVKPYEVVGGVPACHIKYRFREDLIKKIKKTNWWDKEEDWFEKNFKLFLDNESFVKAFNK